MNKPIVVIAVIITVLFLMDLKKNGIWDKYRDRFVPNSCKSALVKLDRRINNAQWSTRCEDKNMIVTVESKTTPTPEVIDHYKAFLYREVANSLSLIASHSPLDNLEHIPWVKLEYRHKQNKVDAIVTGKNLGGLQGLKDSVLIAQHLKKNVQIKESFKSP